MHHRASGLHWLAVEHLLLLLELIAKVVALVATTAHHARVGSKIIATAHGRSLALVHASTSLGLLLLWQHLVCRALASSDLLLWRLTLIIRLRSIAVNHADVVGLEWILTWPITTHHADASGTLHNRLVHIDAHIWIIETAEILQIFNLTLKHSQIVCEHLPIKLLSNILLTLVHLVLLLPCVVDVTIE